MGAGKFSTNMTNSKFFSFNCFPVNTKRSVTHEINKGLENKQEVGLKMEYTHLCLKRRGWMSSQLSHPVRATWATFEMETLRILSESKDKKGNADRSNAIKSQDSHGWAVGQSATKPRDHKMVSSAWHESIPRQTSQTLPPWLVSANLSQATTGRICPKLSTRL